METVEQFLARGGNIQKLPHWVGDNRDRSALSEGMRKSMLRSAKKERPTKYKKSSRWHEQGRGDSA
jgi:hypothetical protein